MFFWRGTGSEQIVAVGITEGSPRRTWSMKRWKVCAALRKPKGIRVNSNNLKGVVTAVLGISEGSTGTWWYALTRSILEKMEVPWSELEKSWMCGIG